MERDRYCKRCGKKLRKLYAIKKQEKEFVGWLKCECRGTKQKVLRGCNE